tara:strand:+ start:274 stop:804 length:531 start_codon:yes stop_codon:yes gene_type:complete
MSKKKSVIFLDRDGVINKSKVVNGKPLAPTKFSEFTIFSYTKKSLEKLNKKFDLIVITNQPDISKKKLTQSDLKKMNNILLKEYFIKDVFFCPHVKEDNCFCRKPKIGLLKKASKKYSLTKNKCFLIGDRKSDILAAQKFGIKPFFIDRNYKEPKPSKKVKRFKNLKEVADHLLIV